MSVCVHDLVARIDRPVWVLATWSCPDVPPSGTDAETTPSEVIDFKISMDEKGNGDFREFSLVYDINMLGYTLLNQRPMDMPDDVEEEPPFMPFAEGSKLEVLELHLKSLQQQVDAQKRLMAKAQANTEECQGTACALQGLMKRYQQETLEAHSNQLLDDMYQLQSRFNVQHYKTFQLPDRLDRLLSGDDSLTSGMFARLGPSKVFFVLFILAALLLIPAAVRLRKAWPGNYHFSFRNAASLMLSSYTSLNAFVQACVLGRHVQQRRRRFKTSIPVWADWTSKQALRRQNDHRLPVHLSSLESPLDLDDFDTTVRYTDEPSDPALHGSMVRDALAEDHDDVSESTPASSVRAPSYTSSRPPTYATRNYLDGLTPRTSLVALTPRISVDTMMTTYSQLTPRTSANSIMSSYNIDVI